MLYTYFLIYKSNNMKKILLTLLVISIGFIGCTDKKKEEGENVENTLNVEQEKEVNRLDSETTEIENVKKDIEDSSNELDELLEEIE